MLKNRAGHDLLVEFYLFTGTKKIIDFLLSVECPSVFLLDDKNIAHYSNLHFLNIDYGIIKNSAMQELIGKKMPLVCTNLAPQDVRTVGERSWYVEAAYIKWITEHISIDIGGMELIIL